MESTLALTKTELDARLGDFLGYGRGPAYGEPAWSARQTADITDVRKSGLRSFYTATAGQQDGSVGYPWSFLKPLCTLTLPSGKSTVPLPDDYHGLEGRLTIRSPSSPVYRPIPVVGLGLVQESYARLPTLTGWPQLACVQPIRGPSPIQGQRFQLYLYPIADAAYTLQFVYFLNLDDLDTARPFPYGGAQHAETILAACLAAAEQYKDDMAGVQSQRYLMMLQGSIAVDRRQQPQLQGYCADRSDRSYGGDPARTVYNNDVITFNGTEY